MEQQTIRKTAKEIIVETVNYYKEDTKRRAVGKAGSCWYLQPETGKKCAYGRCMTDEAIQEVGGKGSYADDISMREPDNLVREEYKGQNKTFWRDLQKLHDNDIYWAIDSVSERGQKYVEELLEKYS